MLTNADIQAAPKLLGNHKVRAYIQREALMRSLRSLRRQRRRAEFVDFVDAVQGVNL